MEALVERMPGDYERGALSRRRLAGTAAGLATGAASLAPPARAAPSLKAITLNHVTVRVPGLHKTSPFYQQFSGMKLAQASETIHILSAGESFFGIEQKPDVAALNHFDLGLKGWDADAMRAKQGGRAQVQARRAATRKASSSMISTVLSSRSTDPNIPALSPHHQSVKIERLS